MGSADDCFQLGLALYQSGEFQQAVETFLLGLGEKKDHWEMRMYLGMCHARLGNVAEARQEFLAVRDFGTDSEIRRKANAALNAMAPTASQQGIKKLSEHAKSKDS